MNLHELKNNNCELIYKSIKPEIVNKIKNEVSNSSSDPKLKNLLNFERINKIKESIDSKTDSINKLCEIIRVDELLTSSILKLSNSPIYPKLKPITELSKAIATIGTKEIRKMTLINGFTEILRNNKECIAIRRIIFNSICSSWVCEDFFNEINDIKKINEFLHDFNVEKILIYASLHSIGKLILVYNDVNNIKKYSNESYLRTLEEEDKYFGITHDLYGMLIGNIFNFPPDLLYIITMHHYINETMMQSNKINNDLYFKLFQNFKNYYFNSSNEHYSFIGLNLITLLVLFVDNLSFAIYKELFYYEKENIKNIDLYLFFSTKQTISKDDLRKILNDEIIPLIIDKMKKKQEHQYESIINIFCKYINKYYEESGISLFIDDNVMLNKSILNQKLLEKIMNAIIESIQIILD